MKKQKANKRSLLRSAMLALDLIAEKRVITAKALAQRAHVTERTAQRVLRKLEDFGLVFGEREQSEIQGSNPIVWCKRKRTAYPEEVKRG